MSRRPILVWSTLALVGVLIAVGVSYAASRLASPHVGLSSEPITAGAKLAPASADRDAKPKARRTPGKTTPATPPPPTRPAEPPSGSPGGSGSTPGGSGSTPGGSGSGGDDNSGHGSGGSGGHGSDDNGDKPDD